MNLTPVVPSPLRRGLATALALGLGLALPAVAAAQPSYEVVPYNGSEELLDFETEYVQLAGLESGVVQQEVNGLLRRAVIGRVTDGRAQAQEWGLEPMGIKHSLDVKSVVRSLTSRIASVELKIYAYTGGAHGNYYYDVINLDLTTGARLEADAMFIPEDPWADLAIEVETALREKYTEEDGNYRFNPLAPEDFGPIAIQPDGLRFLFAPYTLGSFAAGPAEVVVPWARLAGLVDYGIIAPFAEEEGLPSLDLESRERLADRYLEGLAAQMAQFLNVVGWKERESLQPEHVSWPESGGLQDLMQAWRERGLTDMAWVLAAAHTHSWSEHLDAAALADAERQTIRETFTRVLGETTAARVMVTTTLRGDDGEELTTLRPQQQVAVVGPTPPGAALRKVRTSDGESGWVSSRELLVERGVTTRGTVVRTDEGLGLRTASQVVRLLPKDGPNTPDACMDQLQAAVGQTITLRAIERTIGNRYWLAPRSFELPGAPTASAAAGPEAEEGLVDRVDSAR